MLTLPPVWEARLQRVLEERSAPWQVTDLAAGALSDQDRERYLREELMWAVYPAPGSTCTASPEDALAMRDKAILYRIANGL